MSEKIQYVVDSEGKRVAVILPVEEFEELMEEIHLNRAAAESENEPGRPFEEFVEELRSEGEVDV
jgi:PHD/YefM family antitoxin component YafN of YafNO toxin-antitoxin module